MTSFHNILIVRTDRIGDVVLTTPVISALRTAFPNAKISTLVTPLTKPLVCDHPELDDILVDDRSKEHRGLFGFWRLVCKVAKGRYDLAIVFHTKKRTNALCFLAGIPCRLGYQDHKFGFLLTHPVTDRRHLGEKHEAQYCLDVLKTINVDPALTPCVVSIDAPSEKWCQNSWEKYALNDHKKIIAIHPGASDPAKQWDAQYFSQLIDRVSKTYDCRVVMVGGPDVSETAKTIAQHTTQKVVDLTGQTTVSQMVSVIKKCDLLVSNDSGPVHVAAALKTSVVSIFTRHQPGINPERWRPLGENTRVVSVSQNTAQEVASKQDISFAKANVVTKEYQQLIPVESVLAAVDDLMKLC